MIFKTPRTRAKGISYIDRVYRISKSSFEFSVIRAKVISNICSVCHINEKNFDSPVT